MFIMSMKMSKKKIIVIIFTIIFLISGLLVGLKLIVSQKTSNPHQSQSSFSVATLDDIKSYIKSYGWEINENPIEEVVVAIPYEFSDVYKNYNKLQKTQGFDLEKYKGKNVTRITFSVLNYPNMPQNIRANVLIYKDEIIASDICSIELDGFMYGIDSFPKQ